MAQQRVFAIKFSKVYPLLKKIRYMDKLIDELAKGKALEKILRQ